MSGSVSAGVVFDHLLEQGKVRNGVVHGAIPAPGGGALRRLVGHQPAREIAVILRIVRTGITPAFRTLVDRPAGDVGQEVLYLRDADFLVVDGLAEVAQARNV
jgi:hypothetical protein